MIGKGEYKKKIIQLISILFIFKIIISTSVDLGNDESYYWLYSKVLKWNYFDHPPVIAIWIRFFTANLSLEKFVVFIRLGSIFACAVSSWFIYKCTATLHSERAGWFAACLYNCSFYGSISAGLFIFPDSPQMVFFTLSLWIIAKITLNDTKWINWILLGIASGLCIMSKAFGIFIWLGLGIFILLFKRKWLTNIRMYASLLIALIITSPILIWNIHYNFLTYRFNSSRIVIKGFSLNWHSFFMEFSGEIFINNPVNVMLIFISLISLHQSRHNISKAFRIYNLISLPLILLLLFISLYRQTLPHWSGLAYTGLIPLAATRLSQLSRKVFFPKIISISLGLFIVFISVCPLLINYYPGTFSNKMNLDLGKGDISLDMYKWKEAGEKFDTLYLEEIKAGVMPANCPVVCNKWWGAHIEYYFCRPLQIQMFGLGEMQELHEYTWMNLVRKNKSDLSSAYCIINSDDYYDPEKAYSTYYKQIELIKKFSFTRNEKPAHNFYIFRLSGWKGDLPVIQ